MVNMSLKFIGPILDGVVVTTEIKKEAELEWARDTQSALKKRVWNTGGCASWYKTEGGWNSTVYPYTQIWFAIRCMFPTWSDWDIRYTRSGLIKKRAKTIIRFLAYIAVIIGVLRLRERAKGRGGVKGLLKDYVREALLKASLALQTAGTKV